LLADGAACFFEGRFAPALAALERIESVFDEGHAGLTFEKNNARVFRVHTLRLMGDWHRQGALIARLVRAGRQRDDRYLVTTLRLLQAQNLLAAGRPEDTRLGLEDIAWTPPEAGYHLQHWYELRARAELALFERRAAEAVEALSPSFEALARSMLLRVKLVRADAIALRARLLLAASPELPEPKRARREVHRAVRRLERERTGYANVYALLLRAGLAAYEDTAERQIELLRRAARESGEHTMALHQAAARHQLGALLGGDEGAELDRAATRYVEHERIRAPDRLFEVALPSTGSGEPR
jgi:hypothetical protein